MEDEPVAGGDAVQAAAAAAIPEGELVIELAILEYFLHESISLRLASLSSTDPCASALMRAARLRRAQYYSELIQSILSARRPCLKTHEY